MNTAARRKVEMAERVRDFLSTRPFGAEKPDAVVARFTELVARARTLVDSETAGHRAAHATTVLREELRRQLRTDSIRHVARVAKSAETEQPGLAGKFMLPRNRSSEQNLLSVARTVATLVAANRELFLNHGMWDGALDDLNQKLAAYDRAIAEGNAGRAAHTGARKELDRLSSQLLRMVQQLEGMLVPRFREDANLKGAWDSARNVAWPAPSAGDERPAPPLESVK